MVGGYGVDANSIDEIGRDIVKRCHQQVVDRIVKKTGWTVLHTVVFNGHLTMFKLLADRYKALAGKDRSFVTDLSNLAIYSGEVDMFFMLVENYEADF